MDFQSVVETFAEAWVAANTHTPLTEAAEQGRITGPNGINHGACALTASPEFSEKHELENLCTYQGQHSPSDLQSSCSVLGELKTPAKNVCSPHGKSVPVHCVVEQIPGPQACGQYVELDSYAIIPGDTLFSELVRSALVKLGYPVSQILGAKGAVQIKNWKPLAFDQITEDPEATVNEIIGDLATVVTLHIRLYSVPDENTKWVDVTVRNAVLELLREMSQSKLASMSPLSQPMISNIINNRYIGKIGSEKCQEFGAWYLAYRKQHQEGPSPEVIPCNRPADGRLTFHPTKELPTVREWFRACRNPSRRTLQMYVDILNQGSVRQQERPKVSLTTLKNWWKNEKQRERKKLKSDHSVQKQNKSNWRTKHKMENSVNDEQTEKCLDSEITKKQTVSSNSESCNSETIDVDKEKCNF